MSIMRTHGHEFKHLVEGKTYSDLKKTKCGGIERKNSEQRVTVLGQLKMIEQKIIVTVYCSNEKSIKKTFALERGIEHLSKRAEKLESLKLTKKPISIYIDYEKKERGPHLAKKVLVYLLDPIPKAPLEEKDIKSSSNDASSESSDWADQSLSEEEIDFPY